MMARLPVLFLVLLISCAPPPETEAVKPDGREYALTAAYPIDFINEGARFGMLRMRLTGDSARIFNPFTTYTSTVTAYAGERPDGATDSVYMAYTSQENELIAHWQAGEQTYRLRFAEAAPIAAGYWPDSLVGQTYFHRQGEDTLAVHVADMDLAQRSRQIFHAQLLRFGNGSDRAVDWRDAGFAFLSPDGIHAVFDLPGKREPGEMRASLAALGVLSDGTPALYVLGTDTINPVPIDSMPLDRLPALLPQTVTDSEWLGLLNGGRMRVMDLPAEPDSVGIAYQNEEPPEHDPVLRPAEVSQLDIAFAEDNRFTVFAGERIVRSGVWSLSPDRNFLQILPDRSAASGLLLIRDYRDEYLSLSFPLEVETAEPRGVRLRSYYRPVAEVRFYSD